MYRGVLTGGLFDDTEDPTVESAFRYAIFRVNQDRTLLANTKIVYDIQHLPALNSFVAAKKGISPPFSCFIAFIWRHYLILIV